MLHQHSIKDSRVVCKNGCFSKTRYWIEGWHPVLELLGSVRFIRSGFTGEKETELTITVVIPTIKFIVEDVQPRELAIAA